MHSKITIIPTPKTINVLDKKVIIIKPCIYSHNLEWQPLTFVFSDYITAEDVVFSAKIILNLK